MFEVLYSFNGFQPLASGLWARCGMDSSLAEAQAHADRVQAREPKATVRIFNWETRKFEEEV